jgi:SAM-dependent methyltransferase
VDDQQRAELRHQRERLRREEPRLFAELTELLAEHDPVGLTAIGAPRNEYEAEVGTIIPRLQTASDIHDVHRILVEEFDSWFGSDTPKMSSVEFERVATDVWAVWLGHIQYGPQAAERWTETAYADPHAYLAHRAELILSLGPRLEPGDTLLDLACGDGGLAEHLPRTRYRGVDTSPDMVESARQRGRDVVLGDLNDYEPPEPVAATTCFRAIYYARDRADFFKHVAGYTEKKLVFDLNPRQYRVEDVCSDLRAAGFDRLDLRPFFSPQRFALPRLAESALYALERTPVAHLLLRWRFSYLCAASRRR